MKQMKVSYERELEDRQYPVRERGTYEEAEDGEEYGRIKGAEESVKGCPFV
jgi:hypothetical protein